MASLIKKYGPKILLAIIAIWGAFQLYGFGRDLLFGKAMAIASAQYEAKVAALQAKVEAGKLAYNTLADLSAKNRETYRDQADKDFKHSQAVFAVFKSETAAELKKRGATMAEVLNEKEKDEVALTDAKETIVSLNQNTTAITKAWALSDEQRDKAHAEIVANLELQYRACSEWSAKLEKKLKPKLLSRVIQVAVVVGAFALGKAL